MIARDIMTRTVYTIHLVSQTWQGIKWQHKLLVLKPANVKPASSPDARSLVNRFMRY